jgi:battenin
MVCVPVFEFLIFFFLLTKPASSRIEDQHKGDDVVEDLPPMKSFSEKIIYVKTLIHFMIPLGLVYLFEYFINQGLFEMVYFPDTFIDHDSQYRWYQVTYQIGVFISRSSVNLVHIKNIWMMAVLQGINVIFFRYLFKFLLIFLC